MSLFQCSFFSKTLGTMAKVNVLLPSPSSGASLKMSLDEIYAENTPPKVLYLLHGMNEDETIWLRKSNIERYAQKHRLAVVMPYGENSFYINMAHGLPYFDYLTDELPRFIQTNFRVSGKREDTFIAGLSMGGYGACKAALGKPEQYAAFASLSGAVDIEQVAALSEVYGMTNQMNNVVGSEETCREGENNLFWLAQQLVGSSKPLPRGYVACGIEDELCYPMNQKLRDCLNQLSYPLTFAECSGGHEWDFWDSQIRKAVEWLMLQE